MASFFKSLGKDLIESEVKQAAKSTISSELSRKKKSKTSALRNKIGNIVQTQVQPKLQQLQVASQQLTSQPQTGTFYGCSCRCSDIDNDYYYNCSCTCPLEQTGGRQRITVKHLRNLAKIHNIPGRSKMNKQELLYALGF